MGVFPFLYLFINTACGMCHSARIFFVSGGERIFPRTPPGETGGAGAKKSAGMDNTKRRIVFIGRSHEFTKSIISKGFGVSIPDIPLVFEEYVQVTSDEGRIDDARASNSSDGVDSMHVTCDSGEDDDSMIGMTPCTVCMFTSKAHASIVTMCINNTGMVLAVAVLRDPRGSTFNIAGYGAGAASPTTDESMWAQGRTASRDWELIRETVYGSNDRASIGIVFEIAERDFPDSSDAIRRVLDECIAAYDINKDYIKFAVVVCENIQVSIDAMFITTAHAFREMEATTGAVTSPLERVARSVVSTNSEIAEAARELEPLYQSSADQRRADEKKCVLS